MPSNFKRESYPQPFLFLFLQSQLLEKQEWYLIVPYNQAYAQCTSRYDQNNNISSLDSTAWSLSPSVWFWHFQMLLLRLKDLYPKALTVMTVFNRKCCICTNPSFVPVRTRREADAHARTHTHGRDLWAILECHSERRLAHPYTWSWSMQICPEGNWNP